MRFFKALIVAAAVVLEGCKEKKDKTLKGGADDTVTADGKETPSTESSQPVKKQ
jgi:hypothetical protein